MIAQGSTPTIKISLCDATGAVIDISESASAMLTFKDGNDTEVNVPFERFSFAEDKSFEVTLTQEETLSLANGTVWVQLRVKDLTDNAITTTITKDKISRALYKEII